MSDPLAELENSLAYMFELQTKKTGKYIHPAIEKLKNALDNYREGPSISLQELIRAIQQALPVFVKYNVDLYTVKTIMNTLAGEKGSSINWNIPIGRPHYPHFLFSTSLPIINNEFIAWLSQRSDKDFLKLDGHEQVEILVAERGEREFTTKLAEYLRNQPDFLLNLIMMSTENFNAIMETRISFQLENQQIAKAIYQHYLVKFDAEGSIQQLEEQIRLLDECLAKSGRSMEKLLADPLAKAELSKSPIFQLYMDSDQLPRINGP